MEYIYIGFMLAIGGCVGVGTCLFVWRKPKVAGKVVLYSVYLVLIVWAGAYLWFSYSSRLTAWLHTYKDKVIGCAIFAVLYIAALFIARISREVYRRFLSRKTCGRCSHAERHHRNPKTIRTPASHCLALECDCSGFLEMCGVCKHPEYQHSENKCLREGCSCRVRPDIKGAVIAFSLAVFVLVLVIVMRGSGH
jgi:hypothetical protein